MGHSSTAFQARQEGVGGGGTQARRWIAELEAKRLKVEEQYNHDYDTDMAGITRDFVMWSGNELLDIDAELDFFRAAFVLVHHGWRCKRGARDDLDGPYCLTFIPPSLGD